MESLEDKIRELRTLRWRDNKERALKHKWYAITRIDILTITISGVGIYTIFELLKYFKNIEEIPSLIALKISGILFLVSIITNLLSQIFGYTANENEATYNNEMFKLELSMESEDQVFLNRIDKKIKCNNKITLYLTYFSIVLMISGLGIICRYYWNL